MGYLQALMWTPSLLFALHAGSLVDRSGRRRVIMIVSDLARCALLTSIPICHAIGLLSINLLYVVVFGVGAFSVLFSVSNVSLFRSLVPTERYVEGQSLLYGSQTVSALAGPSIGGLLIQVLSAPVAILLDGASFLGSALLLSSIRPPEPPADRNSRSIIAGLRFIRSNAYVRTALATTATSNLFNTMFMALLFLYLFRNLHLSPASVGLLLTVGAVGGSLGVLITAHIERLIGMGRTFLAGTVGFSAPLILVPLAGGPRPVVIALLLISAFASGVGVSIENVSLGATFAAVVPAAMQARVKGAYQTVSFGARPVGALLGGMLGTLIGIRSVLFIAAIGTSLAFLWILPSPMLRFRMPAGGPRPDSGSSDRSISGAKVSGCDWRCLPAER
jgi:MFS family permease